MSDNQKISDELIAKYIENKVTDKERTLVLAYLHENPDEIEGILIMTNAMLLDDDDVKPTFNLNSSEKQTDKLNDFIYSAAAFAPLPEKQHKTSGIRRESNPNEIWVRLDNLSNELKKQ